MRSLETIMRAAALVLVCGLGLAIGSLSHAAAKKPAAERPSPALKDSSIWSATTYEAASKEANKKVLARGRKATVTGEVVEVSCYLQLGKRGAAHVECGSKCAANGQPLGIVDKADNLYILFPEEHHPRRDGQVDIKSRFILLISKTVTVPGTVSKMHGYNALFVKSDVMPDTLGH
jgi:hypothetical protein